MFSNSKLAFFALPLLLQAGLGAASPAPVSVSAAAKAATAAQGGVDKRLFDVDLYEVTKSFLQGFDFGDKNGPCDHWADFVRCANAENVETAGIELCIEDDDTKENFWRVTNKDCGAKRAADEAN